jgi:hypothetical protein
MIINLEDGQRIIIAAVILVIGITYWLNGKLRRGIKHPELTIQLHAKRRKRQVDATWRSILLVLLLTTAAAPKWHAVTPQTGEYLARRNLSGMDLRGEDFRYAELIYVDMRNANLSQADFRGADLRKAWNLTWGQIKEAFIDEETQLPPSLVKKHKAEIQAVIERTKRRFKRP